MHICIINIKKHAFFNIFKIDKNSSQQTTNQNKEFNMKKSKVMAGVLAMTAGMAIPKAALAAKIIEPSFPKKFSLRSTQLVRTKTHDGNFSIGHLYMDLKQESLTPSLQNRLHGEMSGLFYFTSNEKDQHGAMGQSYNTFISLAGDDGELLLDLISKNSASSQYQVYGCNSTLTSCEGTEFTVEFNNKNKNSVNVRVNKGNSEMEIWNEENQQWEVGFEFTLTKK